MPEGIETRHENRCRRRESATARCNCTPSFRATAYDRRIGKQIKHPWTQDRDRAINERKDLVARIKNYESVASAPIFNVWVETFWLPGIRNGSILSDEGEPYKPAVARCYRSAVNKHLLSDPALKDKPLNAIRRKDVQALVDRMVAHGYAGWTVRNALNPLRAMYRYAIRREIVSNNPTVGLELPKRAKRLVVTEATGEKGEMVIRGVREVIQMIDVLPAAERGMFATAALAGLRRGELRALRVSHINLDTNEILVRLGWDDVEGEMGLKSASARRTVPITNALRPYLVAHLAALKRKTGSALAFPGPRGSGAIDADKYMDRCRAYWEEASIEPLGLHPARHTFASLMVASGANIKQISTIMGHADVSTTLDVYGHLLPGGTSEAAAKLNEYLDGELN